MDNTQTKDLDDRFYTL